MLLSDDPYSLMLKVDGGCLTDRALTTRTDAGLESGFRASVAATGTRRTGTSRSKARSASHSLVMLLQGPRSWIPMNHCAGYI